MQCILCQFRSVCDALYVIISCCNLNINSVCCSVLLWKSDPDNRFCNHTAVWCLQAAWLILKSFTLGSSFTHRHSHSAVVFYTTVLLWLHRAVQPELGTVNSILCNLRLLWLFLKARTSKHLEKQCQQPQQMLKVNSVTFSDYFLNSVTYSGSLLGANSASIVYSVSQYISPTRLKMWNWIWITNILQ